MATIVYSLGFNLFDLSSVRRLMVRVSDVSRSSSLLRGWVVFKPTTYCPTPTGTNTIREHSTKTTSLGPVDGAIASLILIVGTFFLFTSLGPFRRSRGNAFLSLHWFCDLLYYVFLYFSFSPALSLSTITTLWSRAYDSVAPAARSLLDSWTLDYVTILPLIANDIWFSDTLQDRLIVVETIFVYLTLIVSATLWGLNVHYKLNTDNAKKSVSSLFRTQIMLTPVVLSVVCYLAVDHLQYQWLHTGMPYYRRLSGAIILKEDVSTAAFCMVLEVLIYGILFCFSGLLITVRHSLGFTVTFPLTFLGLVSISILITTRPTWILPVLTWVFSCITDMCKFVAGVAAKQFMEVVPALFKSRRLRLDDVFADAFVKDNDGAVSDTTENSGEVFFDVKTTLDNGHISASRSGDEFKKLLAELRSLTQERQRDAHLVRRSHNAASSFRRRARRNLNAAESDIKYMKEKFFTMSSQRLYSDATGKLTCIPASASKSGDEFEKFLSNLRSLAREQQQRAEWNLQAAESHMQHLMATIDGLPPTATCMSKDTTDTIGDDVDSTGKSWGEDLVNGIRQPAEELEAIEREKTEETSKATIARELVTKVDRFTVEDYTKRTVEFINVDNTEIDMDIEQQVSSPFFKVNFTLCDSPGIHTTLDGVVKQQLVKHEESFYSGTTFGNNSLESNTLLSADTRAVEESRSVSFNTNVLFRAGSSGLSSVDEKAKISCIPNTTEPTVITPAEPRVDLPRVDRCTLSTFGSLEPIHKAYNHARWERLLNIELPFSLRPRSSSTHSI